MIRCDICKLRFGGQFAYDRHIDRRNDRCRTPEELELRGLHRRRGGSWHQQRPTAQRRLRLWPYAGSRTIEDKLGLPAPTEPVSIAPEPRAQQKNRGSA